MSLQCTPSPPTPVPPADWVNASFLPDASQVQRIRSNLDTLDVASNVCDAEVIRLQGLLAASQARREQLRKHQCQFRSMLSPVRRLPRDILLEIFACCVGSSFLIQSTSGAYGLLNYPSTLPALKLARICAYWREMMLTTPSLWACFECSLEDKSSSANGRHILKYVNLYLDRSGETHLSFAIRATGQTLGSQHPVLRRLFDEAHRWRHVVFSDHETIGNGWPIHLPSLLSFALIRGGRYPYRQPVLTDVIDIRAPSLARLEIPPSDTLPFVFPFSQLTELHLSCIKDVNVVRQYLLACCTGGRLEDLSLTIHTEVDWEENIEEADVLPLPIRHLCINGLSAGRSFKGIFTMLTRSFIFERLEGLTLHTEGSVYNPTATLFIVTFLKSAKGLNLTYLDIDLPLRIKESIRILAEIPHLKRLSVFFAHYVSDTQQLLKVLTVGVPGRPPLLKDLQAIRFGFAEDVLTSVTRKRIASMVTSRMTPSESVACLTDILISSGHSTADHTLVMGIRAAERDTYYFKWVDVGTFSLLRKGHQREWHNKATWDEDSDVETECGSDSSSELLSLSE